MYLKKSCTTAVVTGTGWKELELELDAQQNTITAPFCLAMSELQLLSAAAFERTAAGIAHLLDVQICGKPLRKPLREEPQTRSGYTVPPVDPTARTHVIGAIDDAVLASSPPIAEWSAEDALPKLLDLRGNIFASAAPPTDDHSSSHCAEVESLLQHVLGCGSSASALALETLALVSSLPSATGLQKLRAVQLLLSDATRQLASNQQEPRPARAAAEALSHQLKKNRAAPAAISPGSSSLSLSPGRAPPTVAKTGPGHARSASLLKPLSFAPQQQQTRKVRRTGPLLYVPQVSAEVTLRIMKSSEECSSDPGAGTSNAWAHHGILAMAAVAATICKQANSKCDAAANGGPGDGDPPSTATASTAGGGACYARLGMCLQQLLVASQVCGRAVDIATLGMAKTLEGGPEHLRPPVEWRSTAAAVESLLSPLVSINDHGPTRLAATHPALHVVCAPAEPPGSVSSVDGWGGPGAKGGSPRAAESAAGSVGPGCSSSETIHAALRLLGSDTDGAAAGDSTTGDADASTTATVQSESRTIRMLESSLGCVATLLNTLQGIPGCRDAMCAEVMAWTCQSQEHREEACAVHQHQKASLPSPPPVGNNAFADSACCVELVAHALGCLASDVAEAGAVDAVTVTGNAMAGRATAAAAGSAMQSSKSSSADGSCLTPRRAPLVVRAVVATLLCTMRLCGLIDRVAVAQLRCEDQGQCPRHHGCSKLWQKSGTPSDRAVSCAMSDHVDGHRANAAATSACQCIDRTAGESTQQPPPPPLPELAQGVSGQLFRCRASARDSLTGALALCLGPWHLWSTAFAAGFGMAADAPSSRSGLASMASTLISSLSAAVSTAPVRTALIDELAMQGLGFAQLGSQEASSASQAHTLAAAGGMLRELLTCPPRAMAGSAAAAPQCHASPPLPAASGDLVHDGACVVPPSNVPPAAQAAAVSTVVDVFAAAFDCLTLPGNPSINVCGGLKVLLTALLALQGKLEQECVGATAAPVVIARNRCSETVGLDAATALAAYHPLLQLAAERLDPQTLQAVVAAHPTAVRSLVACVRTTVTRCLAIGTDSSGMCCQSPGATIGATAPMQATLEQLFLLALHLGIAIGGGSCSSLDSVTHAPGHTPFLLQLMPRDAGGAVSLPDDSLDRGVWHARVLQPLLRRHNPAWHPASLQGRAAYDEPALWHWESSTSCDEQGRLLQLQVRILSDAAAMELLEMAFFLAVVAVTQRQAALAGFLSRHQAEVMTQGLEAPGTGPSGIPRGLECSVLPLVSRIRPWLVGLRRDSSSQLVMQEHQGAPTSGSSSSSSSSATGRGSCTGRGATLFCHAAHRMWAVCMGAVTANRTCVTPTPVLEQVDLDTGGAADCTTGTTELSHSTVRSRWRRLAVLIFCAVRLRRTLQPPALPALFGSCAATDAIHHGLADGDVSSVAVVTCSMLGAARLAWQEGLNFSAQRPTSAGSVAAELRLPQCLEVLAQSPRQAPPPAPRCESSLVSTSGCNCSAIQFAVESLVLLVFASTTEPGEASRVASGEPRGPSAARVLSAAAPDDAALHGLIAALSSAVDLATVAVANTSTRGQVAAPCWGLRTTLLRTAVELLEVLHSPQQQRQLMRQPEGLGERPARGVHGRAESDAAHLALVCTRIVAALLPSLISDLSSPLTPKSTRLALRAVRAVHLTQLLSAGTLPPGQAAAGLRECWQALCRTVAAVVRRTTSPLVNNGDPAMALLLRGCTIVLAGLSSSGAQPVGACGSYFEQLSACAAAVLRASVHLGPGTIAAARRAGIATLLLPALLQAVQCSKGLTFDACCTCAGLAMGMLSPGAVAGAVSLAHLQPTQAPSPPTEADRNGTSFLELASLACSRDVDQRRGGVVFCLAERAGGADGMMRMLRSLFLQAVGARAATLVDGHGDGGCGAAWMTALQDLILKVAAEVRDGLDIRGQAPAAASDQDYPALEQPPIVLTRLQELSAALSSQEGLGVSADSPVFSPALLRAVQQNPARDSSCASGGTNTGLSGPHSPGCLLQRLGMLQTLVELLGGDVGDLNPGSAAVATIQQLASAVLQRQRKGEDATAEPLPLLDDAELSQVVKCTVLGMRSRGSMAMEERGKFQATLGHAGRASDVTVDVICHGIAGIAAPTAAWSGAPPGVFRFLASLSRLTCAGCNWERITSPPASGNVHASGSGASVHTTAAAPASPAAALTQVPKMQLFARGGSEQHTCEPLYAASVNPAVGGSVAVPCIIRGAPLSALCAAATPSILAMAAKGRPSSRTASGEAQAAVEALLSLLSLLSTDRRGRCSDSSEHCHNDLAIPMAVARLRATCATALLGLPTHILQDLLVVRSSTPAFTSLGQEGGPQAAISLVRLATTRVQLPGNFNLADLCAYSKCLQTAPHRTQQQPAAEPRATISEHQRSTVRSDAAVAAQHDLAAASWGSTEATGTTVVAAAGLDEWGMPDPLPVRLASTTLSHGRGAHPRSLAAIQLGVGSSSAAFDQDDDAPEQQELLVIGRTCGPVGDDTSAAAATVSASRPTGNPGGAFPPSLSLFFPSVPLQQPPTTATLVESTTTHDETATMGSARQAEAGMLRCPSADVNGTAHVESLSDHAAGLLTRLDSARSCPETRRQRALSNAAAASPATLTVGGVSLPIHRYNAFDADGHCALPLLGICDSITDDGSSWGAHSERRTPETVGTGGTAHRRTRRGSVTALELVGEEDATFPGDAVVMTFHEAGRHWRAMLGSSAAWPAAHAGLKEDAATCSSASTASPLWEVFPESDDEGTVRPIAAAAQAAGLQQFYGPGAIPPPTTQRHSSETERCTFELGGTGSRRSSASPGSGDLATNLATLSTESPGLPDVTVDYTTARPKEAVSTPVAEDDGAEECRFNGVLLPRQVLLHSRSRDSDASDGESSRRSDAAASYRRPGTLGSKAGADAFTATTLRIQFLGCANIYDIMQPFAHLSSSLSAPGMDDGACDSKAAVPCIRRIMSHVSTISDSIAGTLRNGMVAVSYATSGPGALARLVPSHPSPHHAARAPSLLLAPSPHDSHGRVQAPLCAGSERAVCEGERRMLGDLGLARCCCGDSYEAHHPHSFGSTDATTAATAAGSRWSADGGASEAVATHGMECMLRTNVMRAKLAQLMLTRPIEEMCGADQAVAAMAAANAVVVLAARQMVANLARRDPTLAAAAISSCSGSSPNTSRLALQLASSSCFWAGQTLPPLSNTPLLRHAMPWVAAVQENTEGAEALLPGANNCPPPPGSNAPFISNAMMSRGSDCTGGGSALLPSHCFGGVLRSLLLAPCSLHAAEGGSLAPLELAREAVGHLRSATLYSDESELWGRRSAWSGCDDACGTPNPEVATWVLHCLLDSMPISVQGTTRDVTPVAVQDTVAAHGTGRLLQALFHDCTALLYATPNAGLRDYLVCIICRIALRWRVVAQRAASCDGESSAGAAFIPPWVTAALPSLEFYLRSILALQQAVEREAGRLLASSQQLHIVQAAAAVAELREAVGVLLGRGLRALLQPSLPSPPLLSSASQMAAPPVHLEVVFIGSMSVTLRALLAPDTNTGLLAALLTGCASIGCAIGWVSTPADGRCCDSAVHWERGIRILGLVPPLSQSTFSCGSDGSLVASSASNCISLLGRSAGGEYFLEFTVNQLLCHSLYALHAQWEWVGARSPPPASAIAGSEGELQGVTVNHARSSLLVHVGCSPSLLVETAAPALQLGWDAGCFAADASAPIIVSSSSRLGSDLRSDVHGVVESGKQQGHVAPSDEGGGATAAQPDLRSSSGSLISDVMLHATHVGGSDCWATVRANTGFVSGVNRWAVRINAAPLSPSTSPYIFVGVATAAARTDAFVGADEHGWGLSCTGALFHACARVTPACHAAQSLSAGGASSTERYSEFFSPRDVLTMTLDAEAGTLSFELNGADLGVAFAGLRGRLYPAVSLYSHGERVSLLPLKCRTPGAGAAPHRVPPPYLALEQVLEYQEVSRCLSGNSVTVALPGSAPPSSRRLVAAAQPPIPLAEPVRIDGPVTTGTAADVTAAKGAHVAAATPLCDTHPRRDEQLLSAWISTQQWLGGTGTELRCPTVAGFEVAFATSPAALAAVIDEGAKAGSTSSPPVHARLLPRHREALLRRGAIIEYFDDSDGGTTVHRGCVAGVADGRLWISEEGDYGAWPVGRVTSWVMSATVPCDQAEETQLDPTSRLQQPAAAAVGGMLADVQIVDTAAVSSAAGMPTATLAASRVHEAASQSQRVNAETRRGVVGRQIMLLDPALDSASESSLDPIAGATAHSKTGLAALRRALELPLFSTLCSDAALLQALGWTAETDALLVTAAAAHSDARKQREELSTTTGNSEVLASRLLALTSIWNISPASLLESVGPTLQGMVASSIGAGNTWDEADAVAPALTELLSHLRQPLLLPPSPASQADTPSSTTLAALQMVTLARFGLIRYWNNQFLGVLPLLDFTAQLASSSGAFSGCAVAAMAAPHEESPAAAVLLNAPRVSAAGYDTSSELLSLTAGLRRLLFPCTKRLLISGVIDRTAAPFRPLEDEYDYPEELPLVSVSRAAAAQALTDGACSAGMRTSRSLFGQLYRCLHPLSGPTLRLCFTHPMDDGQRRAFRVRLLGEGADDYGGPYREVFDSLAQELQKPLGGGSESIGHGAGDTDMQPLALFILCPCPNAVAAVGNDRDLLVLPALPGPILPAEPASHLQFLGQMIGMAMRSRVPFPLRIDARFWKGLVGEAVVEADLLCVDTAAVRILDSLEAAAVAQAAVLCGGPGPATESTNAGPCSPAAWVQHIQRCGCLEAVAALEAPVEGYEDLEWTVMLWTGGGAPLVAGNHGTRDGQVPWGDADAVHASHAAAVVSLRAALDGSFRRHFVEARLHECDSSVAAVLQGLTSVVPAACLPLLHWRELELSVCGGPPDLDVAVLRANTDFDQDVDSSAPHVAMLWRVLEGFTPEQRLAFLRFVWARSRPPAGNLWGQRFKLQSYNLPAEEGQGGEGEGESMCELVEDAEEEPEGDGAGADHDDASSSPGNTPSLDAPLSSHRTAVGTTAADMAATLSADASSSASAYRTSPRLRRLAGHTAAASESESATLPSELPMNRAHGDRRPPRPAAYLSRRATASASPASLSHRRWEGAQSGDPAPVAAWLTLGLPPQAGAPSVPMLLPGPVLGGHRSPATAAVTPHTARAWVGPYVPALNIRSGAGSASVASRSRTAASNRPTTRLPAVATDRRFGNEPACRAEVGVSSPSLRVVPERATPRRTLVASMSARSLVRSWPLGGAGAGGEPDQALGAGDAVVDPPGPTGDTLRNSLTLTERLAARIHSSARARSARAVQPADTQRYGSDDAGGEQPQPSVPRMMSVSQAMPRLQRRIDGLLPVSHTCFAALRLPAYSSEHRMRHQLLLALQCVDMDGDFVVTGS